jgi:hypothetical protein
VVASYSGHRNAATVGVNFFGQNGEYICSGCSGCSGCGFFCAVNTGADQRPPPPPGSCPAGERCELLWGGWWQVHLQRLWFNLR